MSNGAESSADILAAAREKLTALRATLEQDRTALRAGADDRYADGETIYSRLLGRGRPGVTKCRP